MTGTNNTNLKITVQAQDAMSKTKQLGTSITAIGTKAKGASSTVTSSMASAKTSLTGVTSAATATRTSINAIGTSAQAAGSIVRNTNASNVQAINATGQAANSATQSINNMGLAAQTSGAMMRNNMAGGSTMINNMGTAAQTTSGRMGGVAMGFQSIGISTAFAYTSLTRYDKAQLKVNKTELKIKKTKDNILYYQEMINDAMKKGKTDTVIYGKYVRDLATQQEDLGLAQDKLAIANSELTDTHIEMAISLGLAASSAVTTAIQLKPLINMTSLASAKTKILSAANIFNTGTTSLNSVAKLGSAGASTAGIAPLAGLTAATGAHTGATWLNNAAQVVRNALMGPVGWAILAGAGIAIAAATVYMLTNTEATEENNDAVVENQTVMEEYARIAAETEAEQAALVGSINDGTASFEGETGAIKEANTALSTYNSLMATAAKSNNFFGANQKKNTKDEPLTAQQQVEALDNLFSLTGGLLGGPSKRKRYLQKQASGYYGDEGIKMKTQHLSRQQAMMKSVSNRNYLSKGGVFHRGGFTKNWTEEMQEAKEGRMASNMKAHLSALKIRLAVKDALTNQINNSIGRNWNSLDRRQRDKYGRVKSSAGNYTSRGFLGGDQIQGSFMKGGKDAWQNYKSSVNNQLEWHKNNSGGMRYGGYGKYGSLGKTLRGFRDQYNINLERIIKEQVAAQLKDKEAREREIEKQHNLDGSKAKEYYSKVGTHKAYDVYDRINYRNYKKSISGGATKRT